MIRVALMLAAILLAVVGAPVSAQAGDAAPVVSGARTKGGEGGREYVVRTLVDGGPGSLRKALDQPGPRVIKFAVGGVIELKKPLHIRESQVTVAGETAPSPGITLHGAPLRIWASDVIVRHLRVRVGDAPGYNPEDRDGITIWGDKKGETSTTNVLIENCSVSWAVDENVSLWFPGISGVTIRNTIIAEALDNSLHPKGRHSMGLLVGSAAKDVLIQGNLFAHNRWRNPVLAAGATALVANNLIYDPGHQALHFYHNAEMPTLVAVMGNVVRRGPSSKPVMNMFYQNGASPGTRIYMADNDGDGTKAFDRRMPDDVTSRYDPFVDKPPVVPGAAVKVEPASTTVGAVLRNAGARPWDRDATDKRIIAEVQARTGKIRDAAPEAEVPPAD